MDKDIRRILLTYDKINRKKMMFGEAPDASNTLFGGKNVTIPKDGAHAPTSDWQSAKAWDIPADKGTPVYALADGKVRTMKDYGSLPYSAEKGAKRLYGYGFTVNGLNGAPNIYYAHLENVQVKQGDTIKCGQLIGFIGDSKWIKYDHVHVGVEPPNTIRTLIDNSGNIKCATGKKFINIKDISPDFLKNIKDVNWPGEEPKPTLDYLKSLDTKEISGINFKDNPLFKFLSNIMGGSMSSSLTEEINEIDKTFETISETASSLRQVAIGKHGWTEKSGQLSDGGELKSDMTQIVNEIIEEFSVSRPSCKGNFTAGNDKFHHGIKSYTSRHTKGEAVDLVLPSECHKDFMKLMDKYKTKYNGFNYIDEYRNPTSKATGGHFHLSYRPGHPEGGSKSSSTSDITLPSSSGNSSLSQTVTDKVKNIFSGGENETLSSITPKSGGGLMKSIISTALKMSGLNEGLIEDLGNNVIFRGKSAKLKIDRNREIRAPFNCKVNNQAVNASCRDNVVLEFKIKEKKYFLEYCGIQNIMVNHGDYLRRMDVIGESSNDIQLYVFDYTLRKLSFDDFIETPDSEDEFDNSNKSKRKVKGAEKRYYNPLLGALVNLPFKPFQNVRDENGKIIKKNWASPTEKDQPDDTLNRWSPTYSKKISEEIKRIKGIL